MYKADKTAKPHLFWLNGISYEEKLKNFAFYQEMMKTAISQFQIYLQMMIL